MAAWLEVEGGVGSITWTIWDLQTDFTSDFYYGCGICAGPVTANSTTDPDNILQYVSAKSTSIFGDYQPGIVRNLEPGTYTVYGFTQTSPDGKYWNVLPKSGQQGVTVVVKGDTLDVSPWSWTQSNGEATSTQTKRAYQILLGNQPASNGFSHLVWNDLVDKVAEVRGACGLSWQTSYGGITYLSKNACYVDAGDTLSARIYNSVRHQIGSIRSTGISDRSKGGEVLGSYITTITDVLNDIIESPP